MTEFEKMRQICREAIGNCHYSLCARICHYKNYGYPACMEVCLAEALMKKGVKPPEEKEDDGK